MANRTLSSAVGNNQPNLPADVRLIQALLNQQATAPGQPLVENGVFGPLTLAAIEAYQSSIMHMPVPDGIISPDGPTFASLTTPAQPPSTSPQVPNTISPLLLPQQMPPNILTPADLQAAADRLSCEVCVIQAIASNETGGGVGPFDPQGRPTILFERHIFSKLTGHIYDTQYPDISNPARGGYGKTATQYGRIQLAASLNLDAALRSASWGMFQIMGMNCKSVGYATPELFVTAMRTGIAEHLEAFVTFILSNGKLTAAIRAKEWAVIAANYNGGGYAGTDYDQKLATAYNACIGG